MTPAVGHRIRLRGPWKIVRIDDAGQALEAPQTRKHPEDWPFLVDSRSGRVQLSRTFHAPTNVEDTETVFIVLTGVRGNGDVCLNGQSVGKFTTRQSVWEFPVSGVLPFTNELSITVAFAAPTPAEPQVGIYDVVALDIRTDAGPAAGTTANRTDRL